MPRSSANLITAKGLVTFSNELSVPEGSLVRAKNVNIDERGVITSRRGLNDYGDAFGSDSDRLKQMVTYKDRIIRHFSSTLQFDDGTGTFTNFTGSFEEIEDGYRLKFQEANSNLYFTSSSGIKKISAATTGDVAAGSVEDAGAIKAYDIQATTLASVTGFMPTESKVGYRVVFGKKDNNNNLLLGTPSARFVLTNSSAVTNANGNVEITLTSGLTTEYFYQIYRTAPIQISGALTLNDIDPGDEMQLVIETAITSADLTAGIITVADETPDDFREGGDFLYTNEVTGEGILQANEPPPIAKDIDLFRNSNFYANTKTRHNLTVNLLTVGNLVAGVSKFIIDNGTTTNEYIFDNVESTGDSSLGTARPVISVLPSIGQALDETARSMVRVINRDPSGLVYARYLSGANDIPGQLYLEARDLTAVQFDIDGDIAATRDSFSPSLGTADSISDNLESLNRIYFSKADQPDSVPSVNYINVGPKDEAIERILALRDNLFVLKTDGIYIIDGVSAPDFSVRLLESSTHIVSPDSAVVLNNQIYCLTNQGVATITETGVSVISRPIEDRILDITNSRYTFRLPSFGVSYESDRSYLLWLPTETTDTVATQCYRYNTFERAWTRWDVSATCALVSDLDDKLYIGNGSRNIMMQERKNRDRTDYADRNFTKQITAGKVNGTSVEINSSSGVAEGDVFVQPQYITIAIYNRLLLKLDIDSGLTDIDYESSLTMTAGGNIANKMNSLNAKLLADDVSGIITAKVFLNSDWVDVNTQYNTLIDELNNPASDTLFTNYAKEEDGPYDYESIILAFDNLSNVATTSYVTNFLEGDIEVYKGIDKEIQWSPQHFGNPSILKQMSEGTIIFDQNNFYGASVAYSTDVSAGFVETAFKGKGVGAWGFSEWGNRSPDFYWGGDGNDIPLRVIIPRQKQRGRYLNAKFLHTNARERFRILGISAVVRALSTRAYR